MDGKVRGKRRKRKSTRHVSEVAAEGSAASNEEFGKEYAKIKHNIVGGKDANSTIHCKDAVGMGCLLYTSDAADE